MKPRAKPRSRSIVARAHEERGNEALALVVLGEALAELGSSAAGEHCAAALRLAREIGMAPLIRRCGAHLAAQRQPAFG